MPGRAGYMKVLEWTANGTYPTRGIVCPDGVFFGQYRQVPTGREGWETFSLPLSAVDAACYRIAGNGRTADGPSDALVVEDLAWWADELYAAGWSLDADGYCHPCLWRRAAENDWDLIWSLQTTRRALWNQAMGLRMYATGRALFLRTEAGIGLDVGIAYTGAVTDCGAVLWAGDVDGLPWVITDGQPADARLTRLGALVLPWGAQWRQNLSTDGWKASEPRAWRGHVWVLLTRYDLANQQQTLRLAWVTTSGELVTRWEGVLDLDPPAAIHEAPYNVPTAALELIGTKTALWGRIGNMLAGGVGGPAGPTDPPSDVMVLFDGQVVQAATVDGRAVGVFGDVLAGDRDQWEAWLIEDVDYTLQGGYWLGQDRPYFGAMRFALYKTPRELSIYDVGVEWGDGSGGEEPRLAALDLEWSVDPATDWDHEPRTEEVAAEWSDGSGGATPTVPLVEADWSDGSATGTPTATAVGLEWENGDGGDGPSGGSGEPVLALASTEWADSAPAIDPGTEKVLWLLEEGDRLCSRLRVTLGGLTPAQQAQCRVYVRTDGEDLDVDAWHTYQVAALRRNVFLERPGYTVRIGIVGPAALPVPDVQVEMVRD